MQFDTVRRGVTRKQKNTWKFRGDVDAYTKKTKSQVEKESPQNDHVVDVLFLDECVKKRLSGDVMSLGEGAAVETLKKVFNAHENLNVTTKNVNQSMKGPLVASVNRLRLDRLRSISYEDAARRSPAAKRLVDEGVWENIENAMRHSYDACSEKILYGDVTRFKDGAGFAGAVLDELHSCFEKLHVF